MDKKEVQKLAKLARIDIDDKEAEDLSHEFDSILKYVGEVKGVGSTPDKSSQDKNDHALRNVMREDSEPHESGLYTKQILEQAPAREGDYIKVKKIL